MPTTAKRLPGDRKVCPKCNRSMSFRAKQCERCLRHEQRLARSFDIEDAVEWLFAGRTCAEIGVQMGITPARVNELLRQRNEKWKLTRMLGVFVAQRDTLRDKE